VIKFVPEKVLQSIFVPFLLGYRKVDIRLSGKGNSNSHGARPVHLIIAMIKWIRTSRLSIKNSLSAQAQGPGGKAGAGREVRARRSRLDNTVEERESSSLTTYWSESTLSS